MHEVLKAVNKIVGKGDPIVMTGMTCSGKSTVLGTLAKNDIVKALLWFREGLVQGRTTNVSATITDYAKIPEDKLIMTAMMIIYFLVRFFMTQKVTTKMSVQVIELY